MAESPVATQFEIPGKEDSGFLGIGIGAGPRSSIRVVVRADGTTEFYSVVPGKDPERVVPTPQELAYAKEIVDAQQKANPPPKQPAPQTADEARLTGAQADIAQANAAKAAQPDTITRPRADAGLLDTGVSASETVSKAQADYDLKAQADQRQRLQDLQAQAHQAEQAAIERAKLAIAQDQLTGQQAHQKLQDDLEKIRLEVAREANAITTRGQDLQAETSRRGQDMQLQASREGNQVTLRGQDVVAGTTQRGQDLNYEQSLVGDTVKMADTIASHSAPLWQIAQVDAATRGGWGSAIPPMQPTPPMFGTDPTAFVTTAAQAARQQRAPPYQLPGADQYKLPSA